MVKGFSPFFVCAWVGTGLSMMLIGLLKGHVPNGDEIYAFNAAIKLLDDFLIIPAAMGSLITGILLCWLTNWGFFKFNWIIFKLISTIAQILFGTFFGSLDQWSDSHSRSRTRSGASKYGIPLFQANEQLFRRCPNDAAYCCHFYFSAKTVGKKNQKLRCLKRWSLHIHQDKPLKIVGGPVVGVNQMLHHSKF